MDKTKWVLIWNPIWKRPMLMTALEAWSGSNAMEKGEEISEDRIFSDWCFVEHN